MATSGSLFERFVSKSCVSLEESVRNNVMRMLITRQGTVQACPDYGLPDFNDLRQSKSDLIEHSCNAITKCISQYEPRLEQVSVEYVENTSSPLTITFVIRGTLVGQDGLKRLWSTTTSMRGSGLSLGEGHEYK